MKAIDGSPKTCIVKSSFLYAVSTVQRVASAPLLVLTPPKVGEVRVSCKSCVSENQRTLGGEMGVHFPGLNNVDKPNVWVFPKLVLCLNCGFTEFVVSAAELGRLVEIDSTCS
jgi:hypothetical protein